jgi:hypothetical protein
MLPMCVSWRVGLPIVDLTGKMLSRKDCFQGHHDKLDVGDGHACLLCLFLCILQHYDVLVDAVCLHVILVHVGAEGDHVNGMEPPAVGVKEGHDLKGQHLSVEDAGVLEVVVSDFVDGFEEKFGGPALGCLVTGEVIEAGFVGQFRMDANDCGGIIGNAAVVERQADGTDKGGTMVGGIPCRIREEDREGMDPPECIIGDLHEDGE